MLFLTVTAPALAQEGVLLLAHGGRQEWNERVEALAARIDDEQPVEVAFGMASQASMQAAIDRLTMRGVSSIVAVPLFVSSHSSVITSTEYLLGLRAEPPPELALFVKMDHAHHTPTDAPASEPPDPTARLRIPVPIRMTSALDRHPLVADILTSRAQSLSRDPAGEAIVIVAHGPTSDGENQQWLDDMASLAAHIRAATSFGAVDYLTVRDDAAPEVREAATTELRMLVSTRLSEGYRVLVVPLVISYGGIEEGIRTRLEGLDVAIAEQGLMPDDRLVEWVRAIAASR